jgi:type I restriction enzyme, S subunit
MARPGKAEGCTRKSEIPIFCKSDHPIKQTNSDKKMKNQQNLRKIVPTLRFPGFEGEWEQKKLGEIGEIFAGGTPSTIKPEYWNGSIRWMNSGELNLKQVYEVAGRITESGLKNSSTKLLPKYCVLIGLAGQGKTRGTVAMNMVELCTNQSIASISPTNSIISSFLYHNLDNRYEELRALSTGDGGRGGLNLQIIKSIKIYAPHIKEQQKIASFLSSVDQCLKELQRQKGLQNQYKKGCMQQLFGQQLRFKDENAKLYPDWEIKELKELGEIRTGKTPSTTDKSLWQGNELQFVTPTDIQDSKYQYQVERYVSKTSEIKPLPSKSILYTCIASIGKISLSIFPCITNQQINAVVPFINVCNEYLYYYLLYLTPKIRAQQATTTLPIINKSDFSKFKIQLPCLEEQTKIANFLSAIDEQINIVKQQITLAQQFKKGLLQQMLV